MVVTSPGHLPACPMCRFGYCPDTPIVLHVHHAYFDIAKAALSYVASENPYSMLKSTTILPATLPFFNA
jgi:hypothetical protein